MSSSTPAQAPDLRRASALMASGSMVSRLLGLVRNAMLTMCLGPYVVFNTFNSANILPNYIYILLAGGLLNAILIPQITKAMKEEAGGQAQIDRLLTLILLVITGVGVAVTALAGPIMRVVTGYQGPAFDLAVAFAVLTMPQVFFYCLYVLLGQVLNARGQFAAFMWAPVLANVVQIAGMAVWLWQYRDITGIHTDPQAWTSGMIWWLAGTSTLGIVVQAVFLVVPLWRGGFRYRPRFDFRGHGLREAGSMVGWAFGALVVSQVGGLFAQWVLTHVVPEKSHIAGYGIYTAMFTIFMIPHSLVTTTIVTALFPRLANAVHDDDVARQRSIVQRCLTTPAVAVIPLTAAALALAVPGVQVLSPGFSPDAVRAAAAVFCAMAIGMWPFGIKSIQERYTFAREDGRGTLWFQVLVSGVALVFSLVALVAPPRIAAVLMGFGLSISSLVGAVAFIVVVRRQLGDIGLFEITRLWVRLLIVSVPAGLVAWGAADLVLVGLGGGRLLSLLALAVGGALFGAVFLGLARVFRIREVDELVDPVLARLRRTVPGRRSA